MLKAGLVLLALFAAAYFLEKREMDRRALPGAWLVAIALAGGVTLVVGSVQGLAEAWRTRAAPETDPAHWQDGQRVRVGGVLRAARQKLHAPFSGREAIFLWYNATAQHWDEHNRQSRPSFRGIDVAPCFLETAGGRVALAGIPNLRLLSEEQYSGPEHLDRAANHLARTDWSPAPDTWSAALEEGEALVSGSPGSLPSNLINRLGREVLGLEAGPASDPEIRQRLAERNWLLRERILGPGAEVTVVGTYRANPPRVDVSYGPTSAQHAITPGAAAATASRDFSQTVIFILVLALLTAAGHWVVFSSGGAVYRGLLDRVVSR
jgi:hypothetical protein